MDNTKLFVNSSELSTVCFVLSIVYGIVHISELFVNSSELSTVCFVLSIVYGICSYFIAICEYF